MPADWMIEDVATCKEEWFSLYVRPSSMAGTQKIVDAIGPTESICQSQTDESTADNDDVVLFRHRILYVDTAGGTGRLQATRLPS